MAVLTTILFALLAINLQKTEASPCLLADAFKAQTDEFLTTTFPELKKGVDAVKDRAKLVAIAEKAKLALIAAVLGGQLTFEQGTDVLKAVLKDVKTGKLSGIGLVDVALGNIVKEGVLDPETRVKIVLSAIRAQLYKNNVVSVQEGVKAAVKAALEAGEITQELADAINKAAPETVKIDPLATTSAKEVQEVSKKATTPIGVRKDVRKIAETDRDRIVDADENLHIVTKEESKGVVDQIWDYAKRNDVPPLGKVGQALDSGVAAGIVPYPIKVRALVAAGIKTGLYKKLPEDVEEATAVIVKKAVELGVFSAEIGEKLIATAPKVIKTEYGTIP